MKRDLFTHKRLALIGLIMSLILLVISMTGTGRALDTEAVAEKVSAKVEKRLQVLDGHINKALQTMPEELMMPDRIPDDMVIYLYVNDSLMSWNNQFPILNDRISVKVPFERMMPANNRITSPLTGITEVPEYMNLGSKWYIVKSVKGENNNMVIAGLEIKNSLMGDISRNANGANPKLKVPETHTVNPINETGGSAVYIGGRPIFKISFDPVRQNNFVGHSTLRWCSLLLFITVMVVFLAGRRTFRTYFIVVSTLTILLVVSYIWGMRMNGSSTLFSPSLFADGTFFSLGALLIVNTYITLVNVCTFLIKSRLNRTLSSKRWKTAVYGAVLVTSIIVTGVYVHVTMNSVLENSNINLELYRAGSRIVYSIIVYVSYTGLLLCMLMQMQMLRPAIRKFTGHDINLLNRKALFAFAFITASYFSITSSTHGLQKEKDRAVVWTNRLAVERDLGLELQLRSVEESISGDQLISYLSAMENSSGMILNRITEYYLNRTKQAYNIGVMVFKEGDKAGEAILYNIINNGEPIADGSRFVFLSDTYGRNSYAGIFMYYVHGQGLSRMIIQIEPYSNKEDTGYSRIMGHFRQPGDVNIPSHYSYAKYKGGRISSYKGIYPYPTVPDSFSSIANPDGELTVHRHMGNVHFITRMGAEETIVITRPKRNILTYFTSFSYMFFVLLLLTFIFPDKMKLKMRRQVQSNYFRTRINSILFISSFLILAGMAVVSIVFVYKRNESNMYNLMSSKVSTVQGLLEDRTRYVMDWDELANPGFAAVLKEVSIATKSDITLYTPGGKVFRSTSPEVFERLILGSRIDEEAFFKIRNRNQRFYINKENVADYKFWTLYAPLLNEQGDIIAIMSLPYTDRNYDFRSEALFHASLLINLFLILLVVSLFISTRIVNSMFKPLMEMGKKMSNADINTLEHIGYDGDDEILSLVQAYNLMVKELKDSTMKLAQAERDKAWSQMARQVAHEIKNPLTPIKLEIQRLIRLKQNNNPKWEEKFDQVATVILEHIQILSDTANDFSTFAKLYTEEPVLVDLDKTLKDQLTIFDNKENIRFTYIGMEEAYAMAPKPQFIRVLVNLITNAIQAIEIMQREMADSGDEPVEGHVIICLRNSSRDGYYDIAIEDNGPGVKGENLDKLFTPNFTTKTGGTGLGLAICRNIIEKCGGEIRYQKSFGLGGASFIITIPKH
jgi:signal transduction histidine kinase